MKEERESENEEESSLFEKRVSIIVAMIFNNSWFRQTGIFLVVEKPFRFPRLQLRRTMRRSFSAFAMKVHCPFVNARYTVRRATL